MVKGNKKQEKCSATGMWSQMKREARARKETQTRRPGGRKMRGVLEVRGERVG